MPEYESAEMASLEIASQELRDAMRKRRLTADSVTT